MNAWVFELIPLVFAEEQGRLPVDFRAFLLVTVDISDFPSRKRPRYGDERHDSIVVLISFLSSKFAK